MPLNIPRKRRYPMRPYGLGVSICRAFDVPPALVNHTWRPYAPTFPTVEVTDEQRARWRRELQAGTFTMSVDGN